jgi:hypothetical protein
MNVHASPSTLPELDEFCRRSHQVPRSEGEAAWNALDRPAYGIAQ